VTARAPHSGVASAVSSSPASGTYYKLYVRENDAVAAHLALQMGGCTRSSRLHQNQAGVLASLRELASMMWEEALLLFGRLADLVRSTPRELAAPADSGPGPVS
jgi:hypothetical protein